MRCFWVCRRSHSCIHCMCVDISGRRIPSGLQPGGTDCSHACWQGSSEAATARGIKCWVGSVAGCARGEAHAEGPVLCASNDVHRLAGWPVQCLGQEARHHTARHREGWGRGLLWSVVVCCGPLWSVVVCCGLLWSVVVCCGLLWSVVVRCGLLWSVVVCCGLLWSVVVGCGLLWSVVVCCGLLWSVVVCCGPLWSVVVRCGLLWSVVVGCGLLWSVVVCCGLLWSAADTKDAQAILAPGRGVPPSGFSHRVA